MKPILRLSLASLALWAALTASGCKTTAAAPPLAPGYYNIQDQQMGGILKAAHDFYTSIQDQSRAGTLNLSPTVKQAFNAFGASLNAADSVYLAYHSGTATQVQAQTAVDTMKSQQEALPLPGAK